MLTRFVGESGPAGAKFLFTCSPWVERIHWLAPVALSRLSTVPLHHRVQEFEFGPRNRFGRPSCPIKTTQENALGDKTSLEMGGFPSIFPLKHAKKILFDTDLGEFPVSFDS